MRLDDLPEGKRETILRALTDIEWVFNCHERHWMDLVLFHISVAAAIVVDSKPQGETINFTELQAIFAKHASAEVKRIMRERTAKSVHKDLERIVKQPL